MGSYRDLVVWQKAHALALEVDGVAGSIRGSRYSSLRSQLTRSAMSIPANIVEGKGQESARDFIRFLKYSINSSHELDYHALVSYNIGVVTQTSFNSITEQATEVRKMLHGLINYLRKSKPKRADDSET